MGATGVWDVDAIFNLRIYARKFGSESELESKLETGETAEGMDKEGEGVRRGVCEALGVSMGSVALTISVVRASVASVEKASVSSAAESLSRVGAVVAFARVVGASVVVLPAVKCGDNLTICQDGT